MAKSSREAKKPAAAASPSPARKASGGLPWKAIAIVAVVALLFGMTLRSGGGASSGGKPAVKAAKASEQKTVANSYHPAGPMVTKMQAEMDAAVGPGIDEKEWESYLAKMRKKLIQSSAPIDVSNEPVVHPDDWDVRVPLADAIKRYNATVASVDPMVIVIDDFFTAEECQLMVTQAFKSGLQRSVLAGDYSSGKFDRPVSDIRTSQNAWCYEDCFMDPGVHEVDKKISALTHKDWKNGELFQLLRYEPGQYYAQHTDFIEAQRMETASVRVLTVFLYLNGGGEDPLLGGETIFPRLNVSVAPKRGRVAMWPNVLPGTLDVDMRTEHVAMPVLRGVKYGANKWIHANDFVTPWRQGNTG